MYNTEVKRKCIEMVGLIIKYQAKYVNPKEVSRNFAVPLKSLKRWLLTGPERKRGKLKYVND